MHDTCPHGGGCGSKSPAGVKSPASERCGIFMHTVFWPAHIPRGRLKGSNHKTGAAWNRSLALRLLRQHGALSRRQIAAMMGLRGSTLTYIVRDLEVFGALRTVGKKPSKTVGQKQVLLSINQDMGYTLGISLQQKQSQVLVLNAAGQKNAILPLDTDAPLDQLPQRLQAAITEWTTQQNGLSGRLLGIGVGAPGAIDSNTGRVLHSTLLKADDIPLGKLLADQFSCPVVVDHDARLAALAEATEGAGRDVTHFLLFLINPRWEGDAIAFRSYGSALFLDGKVYRGAHSAAGEMDTALAPPRDLTGTREDYDALLSADAPMTPLLESIADMSASSIATIINLLDVQRVVLGGTFGIANNAMVQRIHDQISRRLIAGPDRHLEVLISTAGAEGIARGAAISAFNLALENGSILDASLIDAQDDES